MRRYVIEKNRFRSEARAYKMHLGCSVTEDDSLRVIVSCVAINHYSQVPLKGLSAGPLLPGVLHFWASYRRRRVRDKQKIVLPIQDQYMQFIANVIDLQFISHVIGVLIGLYIFKIANLLFEVMTDKRKE